MATALTNHKDLGQPLLCGLVLRRLHRATLLFRFLSLLAYTHHTEGLFTLVVCSTMLTRAILPLFRTARGA
jgi:hypothetical protein